MGNLSERDSTIVHENDRKPVLEKGAGRNGQLPQLP